MTGRLSFGAQLVTQRHVSVDGDYVPDQIIPELRS